MRGNPFLSFHRTAESAGYPALLIVSTLCLALVVAPVALLGMTEAGWVLGYALLWLIVALAALTGELDAAMSDDGEPADEDESSAGREGGVSDASDERDRIKTSRSDGIRGRASHRRRRRFRALGRGVDPRGSARSHTRASGSLDGAQEHGVDVQPGGELVHIDLESHVSTAADINRWTNEGGRS